jgi:uncharacterized membrane protein HdeD (DUF308 family)
MGLWRNLHEDDMRAFLYILGFFFLIASALSMTLTGAVIFTTLGILSIAASSRTGEHTIQT